VYKCSQETPRKVIIFNFGKINKAYSLKIMRIAKLLYILGAQLSSKAESTDGLNKIQLAIL